MTDDFLTVVFFFSGYVMSHCSTSKDSKVYFSGNLLFFFLLLSLCCLWPQLSPEDLLMYMCQCWVPNTGLRWEHLCKFTFWCATLLAWIFRTWENVFECEQSSMWMTEISPKNPKWWTCGVTTLDKSSKVWKSVKLDVYFSAVGFFICAHSH